MVDRTHKLVIWAVIASGDAGEPSLWIATEQPSDPYARFIGDAEENRVKRLVS